MEKKHRSGSRELIHCAYCGEDYSASYRRCPFCDEYADEYEEPVRSGARRRGGKRLTSDVQESSGIPLLQIVEIAISLVVIVAAIWIVATKIVPMVDRGDVGGVSDQGEVQTDSPDTSQNAASSLPPSSAPESGSEPDAPPAGEPDTSQPGTEPAPAVEPTPPPAPPANPEPGAATGFTLSKYDVTLEHKGETWKPGVTYSPAGSTASLTWESDNPDVASVSSDGTVTAVGTGVANISAMLPNGSTQACIVRCRWDQESGSASASPEGGSTPSSYTINNSDFTFDHVGETYTLKVNGYSGGVSWSSSDSGVATVSGSGVCTAVANGTCTVTGTLDDGSTVKAIVRVKIS